MLVHARDIVPGDLVITPKWNYSGMKVRTVSVLEDSSTMFTYVDNSIEWFEPIAIVVRKDNVG